VDNSTPRADGSHLMELWAQRAPWYPKGDIELLEHYLVDALKAGPRAVEGHRAVGRYVMETQLPKIRCPVLLIAPTDDPHSYPYARPLAAHIAGSKVVEIPGGLVPLPDQMPAEFARAITDFLMH
jgi:pimeloyl-ACP methyl ester carboxylesterase